MADSIRFFHTADIHFGVENYGRIDPQTGIHTRLTDFEKALAACIDEAIANDIDLFVFAGDAYKTAYPTPTQQKLLMKQWFRLQKACIPLVIVVGNHDHPLSFGRAHALDVFGTIGQDGFYLFKARSDYNSDKRTCTGCRCSVAYASQCISKRSASNEKCC